MTRLFIPEIVAEWVFILTHNWNYLQYEFILHCKRQGDHARIICKTMAVLMGVPKTCLPRATCWLRVWTGGLCTHWQTVARVYTTYHWVPPIPRIPFNRMSHRPFLSNRILVSVCFEGYKVLSLLLNIDLWTQLEWRRLSPPLGAFFNMFMCDKICRVVFINMTEKL